MSIPRLERIWLTIGGTMLVAFLAILLVTAVATGAAPPSGMTTIDPSTVLSSGMFASPGVKQTGPHEYTVHVAALYPAFAPSAITVPVGAKVTFHIATKDVVHGFEIVGTDVNVMVIPGYVSDVTHTFPHKGTYLILCNEYCGNLHHLMSATLTVV